MHSLKTEIGYCYMWTERQTNTYVANNKGKVKGKAIRVTSREGPEGCER
jgi:hypothetical protein